MQDSRSDGQPVPTTHAATCTLCCSMKTTSQSRLSSRRMASSMRSRKQSTLHRKTITNRQALPQRRCNETGTTLSFPWS